MENRRSTTDLIGNTSAISRKGALAASVQKGPSLPDDFLNRLGLSREMATTLLSSLDPVEHDPNCKRYARLQRLGATHERAVTMLRGQGVRVGDLKRFGRILEFRRRVGPPTGPAAERIRLRELALDREVERTRLKLADIDSSLVANRIDAQQAPSANPPAYCLDNLFDPPPDSTIASIKRQMVKVDARRNKYTAATSEMLTRRRISLQSEDIGSPRFSSSMPRGSDWRAEIDHEKHQSSANISLRVDLSPRIFSSQPRSNEQSTLPIVSKDAPPNDPGEYLGVPTFEKKTEQPEEPKEEFEDEFEVETDDDGSNASHGCLNLESGEVNDAAKISSNEPAFADENDHFPPGILFNSRSNLVSKENLQELSTQDCPSQATNEHVITAWNIAAEAAEAIVASDQVGSILSSPHRSIRITPSASPESVASDRSESHQELDNALPSWLDLELLRPHEPSAGDKRIDSLVSGIGKSSPESQRCSPSRGLAAAARIAAKKTPTLSKKDLTHGESPPQMIMNPGSFWQRDPLYAGVMLARPTVNTRVVLHGLVVPYAALNGCVGYVVESYSLETDRCTVRIYNSPLEDMNLLVCNLALFIPPEPPALPQPQSRRQTSTTAVSSRERVFRSATERFV